IEAKLQATDVPSLLSDYDRADSDEDLSLIQGAIELSAHVLFRDPEQLPGQLTGRLVGIKIPSLESLIMQIPNRITYPWLRPLSGSLASPGGPLIRTLQGHTSGVGAVAISQNGKQAISGSFDRTLKLWDLEKGQEIRTLVGHTGRVGAVAISQDGRRAISGSDDSTLRLWDLEKGQAIKTLRGHTDGVGAVAVSQDGRRAISGSFDNTLKLWDLETDRILAKFSGEGPIMAIALSQDGQRMVAGDASGRVHLLALENSPK
ncbi:WD40 repeat domain-containing protein, partial [Methanothrix sp.]|uniref:WD40 repeat domain-containing protein n=1 Tax=Methanothrix sp. TaxID=90426 RepID=UPI003C719C6A